MNDTNIQQCVENICALLDKNNLKAARALLNDTALEGKDLSFAMCKCLIAQRLDALEVFFTHLDHTPHDPQEVFPVALKCAAQCLAAVETFAAVLRRSPTTGRALNGVVRTLIEYEQMGENDDALKKFSALCDHVSEDAMPMVWGECVRMNALRFASTAYPRISTVSNSQLHDCLLQCFRSKMSKKGWASITEELIFPDMFEMVIDQLSPEHENQVLRALAADDAPPNIGPLPPPIRHSFAGPFIQNRLLRKQLERAVEQPLSTARAPSRKI